MDDLIGSLSATQVECLRLVARGKTSKEIAKATGYAPATIDMYLSNASRVLGVKSRREAALAIERWERGKALKLINPIIAPDGRVDSQESADNTMPREAGDADPRTRYLSKIMSLPPIGGRENDLTVSERLLAVLKIALFSTMLLVATVLVLKEGIHAFN